MLRTKILFQNAFNKLVDFDPENIILGGDFNLVMYPSIDSKGRKSNNDKSLQILNEIVDEIMLIDVFRMLNKDNKPILSVKESPV